MMELLIYLTSLLSGVFIGWLTFPMVMFLRARKDPSWDDSNMTNIYRVIAHLAVHPSDLAMCTYPDGSRPFYYSGMDELTDVVKTRYKG